MTTEEDVIVFLEHAGVKGMKWGVRRAKRQQKLIDRVSRTASGKGSLRDKAASFLTVPIRGGVQRSAQRQLDLNLRMQKDIKNGKRKTRDILLRYGGVNVRNLNYSYSKPK